MVARESNSYQKSRDLESALLEMTRIGARGKASLIRKFAAQLIRETPTDVKDSGQFRKALHASVNAPSAGSRMEFSSENLPQDSNDLGPLVDVNEFPRVDKLVLPQETQQELDQIILERKKRTLLAAKGLCPSRAVLFSGPPGVGKTLASEWIAQELGLPLLSLNIFATISSFLGSSGKNIRAVLEFAKSNPCVLLLDEFDALAKAREDDSDVGELKRIVNVLLVELDRWNDSSLLIAATNHIQLLDAAVERRFDKTVTFSLPEEVDRYELIKFASRGELTEPAMRLAVHLTEGYSPSRIVRLMEQLARQSVLSDAPMDVTFLREFARSRMKGSADRAELWAWLHSNFGMSMRSIAEISGVSHPTVSKALDNLKKQALRES